MTRQRDFSQMSRKIQAEKIHLVSMDRKWRPLDLYALSCKVKKSRESSQHLRQSVKVRAQFRPGDDGAAKVAEAAAHVSLCTRFVRNERYA